MSFVKSSIHALGRRYCEGICRSEFESQVRKINSRPIEYRFVFEQLTQLNPTTVLDVGVGTTALPHLMRTCGFLVTATDNVHDYWPNGMFNRHYHVRNDDITRSTLNERFDLITCISALEHMPDHSAAVGNMFKLLNPGGHLVMSFPYNDATYIDNVYQRPESAPSFKQLPYVGQVFSRRELERWADENRAHLLVQEYWEFYDGEFWTFGQVIRPPRRVNAEEKHDMTCLVMRKS